MSVLRKISVGLCMVWIMAAGASAAPTKPTASGGGNGTIYFLRPTPVMGWATKPDIKVDGRLVGELSVGSYLVVSCPHGQHSLSVRGGGLEGGFETQLQVESGKSYFIEVGPNQNGQAIGQQLIGRLISNSNFGQQMPGSTLLAVYVFYQLSAEEGREKIATLKKIAR
jgi:hypothetical protein